MEDERGEDESEDEYAEDIRKELVEDIARKRRKWKSIGNFLTS